MGPETIWIFVPVTALCIPIAAIVTGHLQKIAEIKAQSRSGLSENVRAELDEIKQQIASLRDTTTRFDLSFDATLSHLESRMNTVEERGTVVNTPRYAPEPPVLPVVEVENVTQQARR